MERKLRNELKLARKVSPQVKRPKSSTSKAKKAQAPAQQLTSEEIKRVLKELGKMRRLIKKHKKKKRPTHSSECGESEKLLPENRYLHVIAPSTCKSETTLPQSVTYSSFNVSTMPSSKANVPGYSFQNNIGGLHNFVPNSSSYARDPRDGNSLKIWLDDAVTLPSRKYKRRKKRKTTSILTNKLKDNHSINRHASQHTRLFSPKLAWQSGMLSPTLGSNINLRRIYGDTAKGQKRSITLLGSSNKTIIKKFKPRCAVRPNRTALVPFLSIDVKPPTNFPSVISHKSESTKNNFYTTLREKPRGNSNVVREIEHRAARVIQKAIRKHQKKKKIAQTIGRADISPIKKRHTKTAKSARRTVKSNSKERGRMEEGIESIETLLKNKLALRDKRKIKKNSKVMDAAASFVHEENRALGGNGSSFKGTPDKSETIAMKSNKGVESSSKASNTSPTNPQTLSLSVKPTTTINEGESNKKSELLGEETGWKDTQNMAVGIEELVKEDKPELVIATFDNPAVLPIKNLPDPEVHPQNVFIDREVTPHCKRPHAANLMTPQFSKEDCASAEAFIDPNQENESELYEYSNNQTEVDVGSISIKAVKRGHLILWSFYFEELEARSLAESVNPDNEKTISTEMVAAIVGKWDVVACRSIKFEKLITEGKNPLCGWSHISVLIPTCLGIFRTLSRSALEYGLPLWPDSVDSPEDKDQDAIHESTLEDFVDRGWIKGVLSPEVDIDSTAKALSSLESAYPRCSLQIKALANISEYATWALVRRLENAKGKRLGSAQTIELFSKDIVEECLREIAQLFVLMRDLNGKKLKLSRNPIPDIPPIQRLNLVKKYTTYLEPVFGKLRKIEYDKQSMEQEIHFNNTSGFRLSNDSHGFNTERVKYSFKQRFVTSYDIVHSAKNLTNEREYMGHSGFASHKGQEGDQEEVSSEESMDYKNILEPMQKLDDRTEIEEKKPLTAMSSYSKTDRRDFLSQEVEQLIKVKETLSNARHFSYPFCKEEVLDQGMVKVNGKEIVMLALCIAVDPFIERVDEINDRERAMGIYKIQYQSKDAIVYENQEDYSPGTSPKFQADSRVDEPPKLFTTPIQPSNIFCETFGGVLTNNCVKFLFVHPKNPKVVQSLYLSFREFADLFKDSGFDLSEFISLGRLTKDERAAFYKSLRKRCYWVYDKVYVKTCIGNQASANKQRQNTTWCEGEDVYKKNSLRTKLVRLNQGSPFIEGIMAKLGQLIVKKSHSIWENLDLSSKICDSLNRMGVYRKRCILGSNCFINGQYYFVGINCIRLQPKLAYIDISMSNLYRPLFAQHIFLCDDSNVYRAINLVNKYSSKPTQTFLNNVLSQNLKEETGVLGRKLVWIDPYKVTTKRNTTTDHMQYLISPILGHSSKVYRMAVNSPELGPCVLAVTENHNNHLNKENTNWTSIIDREMRPFSFCKNRVWKVELYQKDSTRNYRILLTDYDFQKLYPSFTKSEKSLYKIFAPGADKRQTKADRMRCLKVLEQKISVQQTEVGSVMLIGVKQKPNPKSNNYKELYFPLKEFLRQKPVLSEWEGITQYMTNGRQIILQTTSKQYGKYLGITVYYMIPLNYWKIKVRVVATGRCFIADIDAETYKEIRKWNDLETGIGTGGKKTIKRMETADFLAAGLKNIDIVPKEIQRGAMNKAISSSYVKNAETRESANLEREPELISKRKQQIAVWADLVSSMQYVTLENGSQGLVLNELQAPIELKEVVHDTMQYSQTENVFIYAEVELKHVPVKHKKVSTFSGKTDSPFLVGELSAIPKPKWSEYSLLLTTTNLNKMNRRTEEARLDAFLIQEIPKNNPVEQDMTYAQLKSYAATFTKRTISKFTSSSKDDTDRKYSIGDLKSGLIAEDTINKSVADMQKTSFMSSFQSNFAPLKEKTRYYEEVIQAFPPILGRVIISTSAKQVLIRMIDPIRNINYDIPISFYQASQDCCIPVGLLCKEVQHVGKRLLDGYRAVLLKQFCHSEIPVENKNSNKGRKSTSSSSSITMRLATNALNKRK